MQLHNYFMQPHSKRTILTYLCIMYRRVFILPKDKEVRDDVLDILYHTDGTYDVRKDRIVTADKKIIEKADQLLLETV